MFSISESFDQSGSNFAKLLLSRILQKIETTMKPGYPTSSPDFPSINF